MLSLYHLSVRIEPQMRPCQGTYYPSLFLVGYRAPEWRTDHSYLGGKGSSTALLCRRDLINSRDYQQNWMAGRHCWKHHDGSRIDLPSLLTFLMVCWPVVGTKDQFCSETVPTTLAEIKTAADNWITLVQSHLQYLVPFNMWRSRRGHKRFVIAIT